jgi:hypothetical protein
MSTIKLPKEHPYFNGRVCTGCGEFKTAENFTLSRDVRSLTGVAMVAKCKPCNEFRKYKSFIKRRYGITYEDYQELLLKQNYCCAICKETHSNNKRTSGKLFVDHCHTTNRVRGLLCSRCNHALGQFDDSPDKLKNAILYLERIK